MYTPKNKRQTEKMCDYKNSTYNPQLLLNTVYKTDLRDISMLIVFWKLIMEECQHTWNGITIDTPYTQARETRWHQDSMAYTELCLLTEYLLDCNIKIKMYMRWNERSP